MEEDGEWTGSFIVSRVSTNSDPISHGRNPFRYAVVADDGCNRCLFISSHPPSIPHRPNNLRLTLCNSGELIHIRCHRIETAPRWTIYGVM